MTDRWLPAIRDGVVAGWTGAGWSTDPDEILTFDDGAALDRYLIGHPDVRRDARGSFDGWFDREAERRALGNATPAGPDPFNNAFQPPKVKSLQYNTSHAGAPIPLVFGTCRVSMNVLEFWGFKGSGKGGKGGKGGEGGGKSSGGKKGGQQETYTVYVAFAFCEGPVSFQGARYGTDGWNRTWANGAVSTADKVGLQGYAGELGQDPDPVFLSTSTNTPVIGYSGTCYVTGTPMKLGSSPVLPSMQAEIRGFQAGTAGADFPDDARPGAVVYDLLTNDRYGAGFPAANVAPLSDWGDYCQAAGLVISLLLDRQQAAARWLDDVADITNTMIVWAGTTLKFIPRGDAALDAHGTTWSPNLTPVYVITDADVLDHGTDTDPVEVERDDLYQRENWLPIEYLDSKNSYNPTVVPTFDQGRIDAEGLRNAPAVTGHLITNEDGAKTAAQLKLQRRGAVLNEHTFRLGFRFALIEPADLLDVTDANLGLTNALVRVTSVKEEDDGSLVITAEELDLGVATATSYARQGTAGTSLDYYVDPGDANPPVVFEPPVALAGESHEVWLVATGDENWGGAYVFTSTDDATYGYVGTVYRGGRQGVLIDPLPPGDDPDLTGVLTVDLGMSDGQLLSGTRENADGYVTLAYVDGELISYQTATLTGPNEYELTYLRRGAYGTGIVAHPSGSQFARVGPGDPSVLRIPYPSDYVGQTIYVKLASFNRFGLSLQDLAETTAYEVVLTGAGTMTPTVEVPLFREGSPTAGEVILRHTVGGGVVLSGDLAGGRVRAAVAPTADAVVTLKRDGVAVATATVAAGATVGTFDSSGAVSLRAGDLLTVEAPNPADATLAGVAMTLVGRQVHATRDVEVHGEFAGVPAGSQVIGRWTAPHATIVGTDGARGWFLTPATATHSYGLRRNGVEFGTMTLAAGAIAPSFTGSTILGAGDVLTVVAPPTPDVTAADPSWVLPGSLGGGSFVDSIRGHAEGPFTVGEVVFRYVLAQRAVLWGDVPGSVGRADVAGASVDSQLEIRRNGTALGLMVFPVATSFATFSVPIATELLVGDELTIVATGVDPTLLGVAFAITIGRP